MAHFFVLHFAALTALILAVIDYRTGKMPNVITLGSLFLAVAGRWAFQGSDGLLVAALGLSLTAAVPLGLFVFTRGKAIGGGDVKALAALGAWLGPLPGLEAEMLGFIVLAVFALAHELWRGRGVRLLQRSMSLVVPAWRGVASSEQDMMELRFGPALAVGTLIVCASSWSGA